MAFLSIYPQNIYSDPPSDVQVTAFRVALHMLCKEHGLWIQLGYDGPADLSSREDLDFINSLIPVASVVNVIPAGSPRT